MLIATCEDSDVWNFLASIIRGFLLLNGVFPDRKCCVIFIEHGQDLLCTALENKLCSGQLETLMHDTHSICP